MADFDDIQLSWKGVNYPVPSDRAMGLLATIEEALAPGGQGDILGILANPTRSHLTRISLAYSRSLRYAGCKIERSPGNWEPITDNEVYLSMQDTIIKGGVDGVVHLIELANGLMLMLYPTLAEEEDNDDGDAPGEADGVEPTVKAKPRRGGKAKGSSKGSTKPLSGKRSSRRKNSGG